MSVGDDVLIINRLNRILDALPATVSLNAAVHQRPNTPVEGMFIIGYGNKFFQGKLSFIDVTINTTLTSSSGFSASFSSSALHTFSTKKTIALEEYCNAVLSTKLPKVLNKVIISVFAYNLYKYPIGTNT